MYYEIIYETGAHSVAQYDSDEEAVSAVKAQQDRAMTGQVGGPSGHPAERIVAVLKYNRHPVELGESQAVAATDLTAQFTEIVKKASVGDMVSVPEVAAAVRNLTSPTVESGPHESNFKMESVGELDPTSWAA